MNIGQLQRVVDAWIQRHGGYWDSFQILARLTEELGEVAAVLQRKAGLRPHESELDLEGELGDVLFTLIALANVTEVDLARSLERVIDKYEIRDSQAWQEHLGNS